MAHYILAFGICLTHVMIVVCKFPEYKTVEGVAGPLVVLQNVRVSVGK
jgi:hypothetical protein